MLNFYIGFAHWSSEVLNVQVFDDLTNASESARVGIELDEQGRVKCEPKQEKEEGIFILLLLFFSF